MSNHFGHLFRITTWGESHGPAVGVVIEGCPAGMRLDVKQIQKALDRRKPGQSKMVSERQETDQVEILSGIFEGKATGMPISLMVRNQDARSKDYEVVKKIYRPSHADYSYEAKYGHTDYRGGGRASARETVARVAAGAVANLILKKEKIEILAYVKQIHELDAQVDPQKINQKMIEGTPLRCPDKVMAKKMMALIEKMKKEGDSVGGVIEVVVKNMPVGLGSPVFDKLEARLAQAMLSIPACRGFEIGSGFQSTHTRGSEHNDVLRKKGQKVITLSNHAGGIVGGVSNGMELVFRVAFKPPSSIRKTQKTLDKSGKIKTLNIEGRHDPCVLPRAVPIVEAMTALVLADEWLLQKTVKH